MGKSFIGWSEAAGKEVELEGDLVKPMLKGENIQRYEAPSSAIWIFYPYYQDRLGKTRAYDEAALRARFPKAFAYVKTFKSQLIAKKVRYKMNADSWFSLHRPREMSVFEQPKLITPQLQNRPSFTFDKNGWYPDGGYSIILKRPSTDAYMFTLGVLNSSLLWYFIQSTSNPYNNGYYYFKTKYLEPFPFPAPNPQKEALIAGLSGRILATKRQDVGADVSELERELDRLVFVLYGLTPEEIQIVEASSLPVENSERPVPPS